MDSFLVKSYTWKLALVFLGRIRIWGSGLDFLQVVTVDSSVVRFIHLVLMTASIKLDYSQSLKRSNWRFFIQLDDTANLWPQCPCGMMIQFTLGRKSLWAMIGSKSHARVTYYYSIFWFPHNMKFPYNYLMLWSAYYHSLSQTTAGWCSSVNYRLILWLSFYYCLFTSGR